MIGTQSWTCTPLPDGDLELRLNVDAKLGLRVGSHDLQREGDLVRLPLAVLLADVSASELGQAPGLGTAKKTQHQTQLAVVDDGEVVKEIRLLAWVEAGYEMPAQALAESLRRHDISSGSAHVPPNAMVVAASREGVRMVGEPKTLREIDWVVVEDRQPAKQVQCGPYVVAQDPLEPTASAGPPLPRMLEVPRQVSTVEVFDARTGERLQTAQLEPEHGCPSDLTQFTQGIDTKHHATMTVLYEQLLAWIETQRASPGDPPAA